MFTLKHFDLADINSSNQYLQELFVLFKETLNHQLSFDEFRNYFFGKHPDSISVSLIQHAEHTIGFASAATYPQKIDGKKIILIRSAFGLKEFYKKGKFPLQSLFFKYIKYKLSHPKTQVYICGHMANALMYAMIAKFTYRCYPHRNRKEPNTIKLLRKTINKEHNGNAENPNVIKLDFNVHLSESDIQRIETSNNKDVHYYLQINPYYKQQYGVQVIVPVTFSNMVYTIFKYFLKLIKTNKKRLLKKLSFVTLRGTNDLRREI